jgi:hypothetical protein
LSVRSGETGFWLTACSDYFRQLRSEGLRASAIVPKLDLSAEHRLESRRAIAACKATITPIGGGELNKFAGASDVRSKRKEKANTMGKTLSL